MIKTHIAKALRRSLGVITLLLLLPFLASLSFPVDCEAYAHGVVAVCCDVPAIGVSGETGSYHAIDVFGNKAADEPVSGRGPRAKASPLSGPVGTKVTIDGAGFRVGEDGITITYDGEIILCNIVAEADGSWSAAVEIPPSTQGYHKIGIYGSSFTPIGIVPNIDFAVVPQVTLQFGLGSKSNQMSISGSGFARAEAMTLMVDATKLDAVVVADDFGSFNITVQTPQARGKDHVLSVSGNKGNNARANYVTEVVALPAPQLLSPEQGTTLEIYASAGDLIAATAGHLAAAIDYLRGLPPQVNRSAVATFRWSSVEGADDISYVLEISPPGNLSNPVLSKGGLAGSTYTLSEADSLGVGRYRCRVKALDNRGNESPWSDVLAFEVVSMSAATLVTSVSCFVLPLAALVVVLLVWRAGRRKSR